MYRPDPCPENRVRYTGETKFVADHVWVGRNYRIHFRVIERTKSLEIGYLGKHLPTVKFQ